MATCITSQYFLPRLFLCLLAMTWHFFVIESAPEVQLRAEVGGNVTFQCPVDKQKKITFFYFQRGTMYVNGYYTDRMLDIPTWENTRLDRNKTAVHMYDLNISHIGDYHCHIQYGDGQQTETIMHLSLTGHYSKPEVTTHCNEGTFSCLMTCFSHGGYPGAKVTWNVPDNSSQMCRVVNSSEKEDPGTLMFNSSSTAFFNCSNGEPIVLSCSVGNITSDSFTVCAHEDNANHVLIIAICGVLLFTIVVVVLVWKCKTRQTAAVEVMQGRRTDVLNEEVITMVADTDEQGGEEGS